MSTFDEEYDSDAEYVPDFDMVDLSDFQLTDGGELVGGSEQLEVFLNADQVAAA